MSRRLVAGVAALGLSLSLAADVRAQETTPGLDAATSASTFSFLPAPAVASAAQIQRALQPRAPRQPGSSALLNSLYVSTVAMQALDMHSTLSAFRAGGVEANPLMQGVTTNRAAFLAVKAGVAASTVLATRQLAKRNKVAAIVTLVAINSAYAFVVNHNYKIARGVN
jgi:hypothetical protein